MEENHPSKLLALGSCQMKSIRFMMKEGRCSRGNQRMFTNFLRFTKTKQKKSKHILASVFLLTALGCLPACWKAAIVGGSINRFYLADGVYEGSDSYGPNKAAVKVTIKNGRIVKIDVLQNWGLKAGRALPTIPDRIIKEQSTAVDAVTGATNSSHVIMNAVHKAILKAVRKSAFSYPCRDFLRNTTGFERPVWPEHALLLQLS